MMHGRPLPTVAPGRSGAKSPPISSSATYCTEYGGSAFREDLGGSTTKSKSVTSLQHSAINSLVLGLASVCVVVRRRTRRSILYFLAPFIPR